MNYTEEQLLAINTRDRSLLVSAAAGAGKTATLTKRIISALLDPEKPEDISQMLIVTFTNAAVGELKERIGAAIRAALAENPDNPALERQLLLLPMANISTIDAFCNNILKKNGDKVGAPTNYRIADTAEFELLSHNVLSGIINSLYEGDMPEIAEADEFAALADALTSSKRNAELEEVLLHLYNKSKSAPEGVEIFSKLTEAFTAEDPLSDKYVRYGIDYVHEMAAHYAKRLDEIASSLDSGNKYSLAYKEVFALDAEYAKSLLMANDYNDVRLLLEARSGLKKTPWFKNYERGELECEAVELRAELKDYAEKAYEKFFFYSEEEWRELYPALHSTLKLLSSVLVAFDKEYTKEKLRRSMLEYSDIERYAYLALYENGEPSDVALSIREEFSSIYIDEYQDVNALQGKIFDAVSKPHNRFMVGDIKQSIYGFRSADPDIFANMKKSFPSLENSKEGGAASIFMSKNFRCDRGIINFVNCIFDKIFAASGESIGYVSNDKLGFAKKYSGDEPKERAPEFILIPGLIHSNRQKNDEENDGDDDNNARIRRLECEHVAEKIKEILDTGVLNNGNRPKPKDIAIIVRRNKERLADYAAALEGLGIPSEKREDKEFFLNAEVLLALSLLNSIDNPKKDIYLAGLMLSPIYKFTPDELYFMRKAGGDTLYDSLVLYSEQNPDWEKGRAFIAELDRFRALSEGMPTDALILRLYKDTGLIDLADDSGAREHLLLLYDYAKKFSASSYRGLYNFIRFINNVIDNGAKLDTAPKAVESDAVNILTVHASKGLEFPIVFYVDTDAIFYNADAKERIAYSEKFGMSLCLRSPEIAALVDNPVQKTIRHYSFRSYIEEEFRVSYVALTRARESLFVVGCAPLDVDKYLNGLDFAGEHLDSFSVYNFKCALDFMLATARSSSKLTICDLPSATGAENEDADMKIEVKTVASIPVFDDTGIDAELLRSRFDFQYKNAYRSLIPEKLSVSRLYPAVLDGNDPERDELSIEEEIKAQKPVSLPEFFTGSSGDESAKRGTATHLFMQFFDPESFSRLGAKGELDRLLEKGFISEEDRTRVRIEEIEAFGRSDLYGEIRSADEVYREFRFNTRLDAKHFTKSEELLSKLQGEDILVQGVIDCIYRDKNGKLHLIDYKTDRLTREELQDRELARRSLSERHALQLNYYALATEKIFGKPPADIRIYSLHLGDTVEIEKVPG